MNKRTTLLTTVIGAALTLGATASAFAATNLKLSHNHPHETMQYIKQWTTWQKK